MDSERGKNSVPSPASGLNFDFGRLLLQPPLVEFEEYVKLRTRSLETIGDEQELEVLLEAVEVGKKLLEEAERK